MDKRTETPDLEKDVDLIAIRKKAKKIGCVCVLKSTGLFIAGEKEGMPSDAALDSFHLHLYKNGSGKVVGLATYVGKDMDEKHRKSLTTKEAGKKLHTPIKDFENPPSEIPEALKDVSAIVAGILAELD
jgi:hypothetical protein